MKSSIYVEYSEKQIAENELVATAKRIWVDNGHKASELKSLQLYIKPEDNAVYCVFNNEIEEKFTLD